jgi:hypothetical protein
LDFDLKLNNRNATGDEKMKVEVFNGSTWSQVAIFDNEEGFDYSPSHINITTAAKGRVFQVRFNAIGENSFDVISWFVDNIHIYRVCTPPTSLTGEYVYNGTDSFGAEVCWNGAAGTTTTEELIYDNNVATGAYSYEGYVMSSQMSPDGPCQVLKLKYYTTGTGGFDAKVFDWAGTMPGTTELYSSAEQVVDEDWVLVDITAAGLMVTGDFMVGFGSINATAYMGYDADLDNGRSWDYDNAGGWEQWNEAYLLRAIVEYSDGRIAEIGAGVDNSKVTLSPEFSLNQHSKDYSDVVSVNPINNQSVVSSDSERVIEGFNLYRKADGEAYSLLTMVPAQAGTTHYCYFDEDTDAGIGYFYQVTAVYGSETDACESAPGKALVDPTEDFVYVLVTDINSNESMLTRMYPNPANDNITIESSKMNRIVVMNTIGQVVYEAQTNGVNKVTLNTISFEAGVYVVRIETDGGTATKRFTIVR